MSEARKKIPCPACDVKQYGMQPIMALAYGVSLGAAFSDMHHVTELMCQEHRTTYVMAMMHASVLGNTCDDDEEPFAALDASKPEGT